MFISFNKERVHNAWHKSVTSTMNKAFFKTSGLCIVYLWTLDSTIEFMSLMILICFKWIKEILIAYFDEKATKMKRYAKTRIHVPDRTFVINIYFKSPFSSNNFPLKKLSEQTTIALEVPHVIHLQKI